MQNQYNILFWTNILIKLRHIANFCVWVILITAEWHHHDVFLLIIIISISEISTHVSGKQSIVDMTKLLPLFPFIAFHSGKHWNEGQCKTTHKFTFALLFATYISEQFFILCCLDKFKKNSVSFWLKIKK